MLKYVNYSVVFQEIPDETTLSINISGCPCYCPGCHSAYLWKDDGEMLTPNVIDDLINRFNKDITCIALMGGDKDPTEVEALAQHIRDHHSWCKTAWYSGRQYIPHSIDRQVFDYIKVGPYIEHLGALTSPRTNQKLLKRLADGTFEDITRLFWKKTDTTSVKNI